MKNTTDDFTAKDSTRFKAFCWLLVALALLSFCYALSGCKSERWATRKLAQVQAYQPGIFAGRCADAFPVKESTKTKTEYLPGKPVFVPGKTVYVDCDSAVKAAQKSGKPNTAKAVAAAPVHDTLKVTDTLRTVTTVTVENTARISALTIERDNAKADVIKAKDGRNAWRLIALILLAYAVVRIALRFWLKIALP